MLRYVHISTGYAPKIGQQYIHWAPNQVMGIRKDMCCKNMSRDELSCQMSSIMPTVFRRINAAAADAENNPSSLSDFNETRSMDYSIR